jgi:hypothetical protein
MDKNFWGIQICVVILSFMYIVIYINSFWQRDEWSRMASLNINASGCEACYIVKICEISR